MQYLCCILSQRVREPAVGICLLRGDHLASFFVAANLLASEAPACSKFYLRQSRLLAQGLRVLAVQHVVILHFVVSNGTFMFHHLISARAADNMNIGSDRWILE
ncbi:hypothetical protein WS98_21860 [Burkholderia territorii]|nr:hypothetical protein WS98_21860 [Burkholderia territorii]